MKSTGKASSASKPKRPSATKATKVTKTKRKADKATEPKGTKAQGKKPGTTTPKTMAGTISSAERLSELRVQVGSPTGASGRRIERKPWTARVQLVAAFSPTLSPARTTNLSDGGVFVETPLLLEVGDPVILTFEGKDSDVLRVSGRVRWATPFGTLDDPRPGMGIEFTGLDAARRRRVEALFERLPLAPLEDAAE